MRDKYEELEKEFGVELSHFSNNMDDLPTLEERKPNSMVVFDDCLLERQIEIKKNTLRWDDIKRYHVFTSLSLTPWWIKK